VEVIARGVIQHGLQRSDLRHIDRSGWKAGVAVRVVRRVDLLVDIKYALEREVANGKLQRRVCLKGDSFPESIDIQSCDYGCLFSLNGFCLNDGGEDGDLNG